MEGKDRGMWKEIRWKRDLGQAQEDFGRGSAEQNILKLRRIEARAGGKLSTRMLSETQAKKKNNRWRGNRKGGVFY